MDNMQLLSTVEASEAEGVGWNACRLKHLQRIIGPGTHIVERVPRSSARLRPLSGRWVGTAGDDGEAKSRWTTCGFEQHLDGCEDFYASTPPRRPSATAQAPLTSPRRSRRYGSSRRRRTQSSPT